MFSNQDVDYSLNRPCRTLSAVAPPPSKSSQPHTSALDENADDVADIADDGWEDDDDDYLEASSSLTSHAFLVGSATPSVSKLSDDNDEDVECVEEDDAERINRLYLLQYHEDSNELTQDSSWVHPTGEVWSVGCHPARRDWVVTCGGGSVFSANAMGNDEDEEKSQHVPLTQFQTTLWRLSDLDDNGSDDCDFSDDPERPSTSASKLEPLVTIPHGRNVPSMSSSGWEQRVGQILWNPLLSPLQSSGDAMYDLADISSTEGGGNLITVGWHDPSPISLWDISSLSTAKEVWSTQGSGVASSRRPRNDRYRTCSPLTTALPRRVSWDPTDTHQILATSGVDVVAYDMRAPASSDGGTGVIRSAHRYGVSDVCHNPLQSHVVVTSGMDGVVKFWDLRMHLSDGRRNATDGGDDKSLAMPPPLLKAVRGGHSHWVTRAIFNIFYDQLVLSGGSDGIANLWRISSCSSAPLLDLNDEVEDGEGIGGGSFDGNGIEEEKDENLDFGGDKYWLNDKQPAPVRSEDDDYHQEDKSKSPRKNESNAHDIRVTRFECADVTADLAWSASDPWVYATLSYDGAVVVHHVPSKEKYKILL